MSVWIQLKWITLYTLFTVVTEMFKENFLNFNYELIETIFYFYSLQDFMACLRNSISFVSWCSLLTKSLPGKTGALQVVKAKQNRRKIQPARIRVGLLSTSAVDSWCCLNSSFKGSYFFNTYFVWTVSSNVAG